MIQAYQHIDILPLTVQQRYEIYSKMTVKQRDLLDDYRKYLLRSEFLQNSYLQASDWRFDDLKIDYHYPKETQNQLFCQCGRRLKFQYIIVSKATGESLALGRQHFKDHLNIPAQVATEINRQINHVDLGIDELFTYIKAGIPFPNDIWQQYQYLLFQNHMQQTPLEVDLAFIKKVAAFSEADMPLYFTDMTSLNKKLNVLSDYLKGKKEVTDESAFDLFKEHFYQEIEREILFQQTAIWSEQIKQQMKKQGKPVKISDSYFLELYHLIQDNEKNASKLKTALNKFSHRGMGRWIQKEVYQHLYEQIIIYGLSEELFTQIHPFFREGLQIYVTYDKRGVEVEKTISKIESLLEELDTTEVSAVLDYFQLKKPIE